jgi:prepilin-type N-terminal cleavage/methylation domain-containing protein
MSRQRYARQSGYSLVELLVTIIIAGTAFAALVPVFIDAHQVNQSDTVRTVARNVASDRIEKIRQLDYDDIEFDATKLNDPDFADGQFGPTWPNYDDGTRVYHVVYAVAPVPADADPGLEQYKQITVSVYWAKDFDPSSPPPDDDAHRVQLSTFIYRQFAGPRITVFDVAPIDDSVDPPWVVANSGSPVILTAMIDQADVSTTALVRFSVTALNGAQVARADVRSTDTSATGGEPGYFDGELTYEWPWDASSSALSGTYTFSVTALSKNGYPGNTYQVTYRLEQGPPPAPTGLAANAGFSSIQLMWDASPSGDVDHYAVWRSVDGGVWTQLDANVPSPTYTDSNGILMGHTYTYRVYAIDLLARWSVASSEVTTTPKLDSDKTAPPAPPLSSSYTRVGKSVTISWTQVADSPAPTGETQSGMMGYRVYRSTTATFPGDTGLIWDSGGLTGTYNDSDITKSYGVTYYYWVRAYDNALNVSSPSGMLAVPMGAVVKFDLTIKNASTNKAASVYIFCTTDLQWYTQTGAAQSSRPPGVSIAKQNAAKTWSLPAYQTYVVYYSYSGVAERNDKSAYLDAAKTIVISS